MNEDQKEKESENNEKKEEISKEKKYDFILSAIKAKGDKKKKEKEKEENDDNNGMKEYIDENEEKGFSERQNIYEAGDELKKIQDNNSSTFILKAEPILNNDNNKEEPIEEQNSLDTSSKMSGFDKSSIYTFFSNSKFSELIKKNSKCSPLLLAILLGSCGLFYLAYKKLKLKEIIAKLGELFKVIPGFFNSILAFIGAGIDDFMERYDDIYRFLVGIITVICFWVIFRLLMNKVMKRKK